MEKIKYLTRFQKNKLRLSDKCLVSGLNKHIFEHESSKTKSPITKNPITKSPKTQKIQKTKSHNENIRMGIKLNKCEKGILHLQSSDATYDMMNHFSKNGKLDFEVISKSKDTKLKLEIFPKYDGSSEDTDDFEKNDPEDSEEGLWYSYEEEQYLKILDEKSRMKYNLIEKQIRDIDKEDVPFRFKLLQSNLSIKNKLSILKNLDIFYSLDENQNEYHKLNCWIKEVQKIPFGKYIKPKISLKESPENIDNYLKKVYSQLDQSVYGHHEVKIKILQIISKWISNPKSNGNVIALCGPMGNGKTTLVKKGISKAIGKPVSFVGLGGASNSSFLNGHSYTYEGSKQGIIVEILQTSGCMNPIMFFDELDKLSETKNGKEISDLLCHITDPTYNYKFKDKYFSGLDFDISKALFIFSFNDETKINCVLKDRINVLRMKGFKTKDKINIFKNYLLPDVLKEYNFKSDDVHFDDEIITFIINNFTKEKGVRKLKEMLDDIISKLNICKITETKIFEEKIDEMEKKLKDETINLRTKKAMMKDLMGTLTIEIKKQTCAKSKKLIKINSKISFPLKLTREIINELIKKKDDIPQSLKMMYM